MAFLTYEKQFTLFKMFSLSHTHTIFLSSPRAKLHVKRNRGKIVLNDPAGDLWPQTSDPEPAVWERVVRVNATDDTRVSQEREKTIVLLSLFEAIRYPILCAGAHITSSTALHPHSMHSLKALFPLWERKEVEKYMGVCKCTWKS